MRVQREPLGPKVVMLEEPQELAVVRALVPEAQVAGAVQEVVEQVAGAVQEVVDQAVVVVVVVDQAANRKDVTYGEPPSYMN